MRLTLLLLLAAISVPATGQVTDDFSDGDFTTNPPGSGDTDRFTIVPFGAVFALQSFADHYAGVSVQNVRQCPNAFFSYK